MSPGTLAYMICIECAAPVDSLYTFYSEDNIHATKCSRCDQFADSYIECDNLLVVIDLILLRPAAIRHVVFNTNINGTLALSQGNESAVHNRTYYGVSLPVARLLVLVTLFDVYLQWAMYEKSSSPKVLHFLLRTHPVIQYVLFMTLSVVNTITVHFTVRKLARILTGWKDASAITTALLICSFSKLLPILTFIWHYDIPFASQVVQYVSLVCTLEILAITLDCGYLSASLMTLCARGARTIIEELFWRIV